MCECHQSSNTKQEEAEVQVCIVFLTIAISTHSVTLIIIFFALPVGDVFGSVGRWVCHYNHSDLLQMMPINLIKFFLSATVYSQVSDSYTDSY